jgi:multiple sugar transport system substrate-binding protein
MKTHRKFKTIVLWITALLVLSLTPLYAQSDEFDWQRFEGTTLRFLAIQGPWIDATQNEIEAFVEATGITVSVEILPEAQAWDKIRVEMQAGSTTLDAYLGQIDRFGVEFSQNGWYEPLEGYINNPALTSPDFEWEIDFLDYSRNVVTFGENIVGIPTERVLGPVVYYRKDILEQYNIPLPTTLEELEAAAITVFEQSGGEVNGIVMRGNGASATSQFAAVMHEFGARWQDENGVPLINSPEFVAAAEWWGRALRESGNDGATAFGFAETVNEFMTGRAAFALEGGLSLRDLQDPTKSSIVGQVGYMVIPEGPGGPEVRLTEPCRAIGPFALSISAFSQNKEAAWYLVQWLTGKEAQLDLLLAGRVAARNSAWDDSEFTDNPDVVANAEYWDAIREASEICYATPGNAPPAIRDVGRAREIIGQVLVASILGLDVQAAADQAQAELVALLESQ